jgi:bacterial/archaeal transporter family-2 protein
MSATYLGYFMAALVIGCGSPFQAGINASLARVLGHPLLAAATNTLVASMAILVVMAILRVQPPSIKTIIAAPWWVWCGGLIGGFAVFGALNFAPKMGAAAYVSVTIMGMMLASLLVDHFGIAGFRQHALTLPKVAGAGLVVAGMAIIQFQR